ncbi:MAG: hypothetical protein ACOCSM_01010 [Bacillota bacterium]
MDRLERILLVALMIVSAIMFYNLVVIIVQSGPTAFSGWIHYPFYLLIVGVPPFMFYRWGQTRTFLGFQKFILSLLPGLLFLIWLIAMFALLGEPIAQLY